MKAVMKAEPAPGLVLRTVPDPTPAPGEVVLRVLATSLCGTDSHIYRWDDWASRRIHPPRILGHEMCGEIVAMRADGSQVEQLTDNQWEEGGPAWLPQPKN